jgi:hypothetical protein
MPDDSYDNALAERLDLPSETSNARRLVHFATLAASSHNTQPWLYRVHDDAIDIEPDFSRRTPVVDPDDHHLYASLGCAAENLAIAARHFGRGAEVTSPGTNGGAIKIAFTGRSTSAQPLFDAIPRRQCSRSLYDGSAVSSEVLRSLVDTARSPAVEVQLLTDKATSGRVLDLVLEGNRTQLADDAFRTELKSWLRFNHKSAGRRRDGLLSAASGNPSLPDWLGPIMYDLTVRPEGDNERVAAQVRSSSGLAIFSATKDNPTGWVAAGRAYQRFALTATLAGLQHAFVNQAVEVPSIRAQLQSMLGLGDRRANLIVRFGPGPFMPRSLRRPVDDVIIT